MIRRNTAQRDRDRATIRRSQPPCWLCGQEIDYSLPYLDRMEFVVDHVVPLTADGTDDITNKRAAHRSCNRAKGARLDGGPVLRRSGSLARPLAQAPLDPSPPPFST